MCTQVALDFLRRAQAELEAVVAENAALSVERLRLEEENISLRSCLPDQGRDASNAGDSSVFSRQVSPSSVTSQVLGPPPTTPAQILRARVGPPPTPQVLRLVQRRRRPKLSHEALTDTVPWPPMLAEKLPSEKEQDPEQLQPLAEAAEHTLEQAQDAEQGLPAAEAGLPAADAAQDAAEKTEISQELHSPKSPKSMPWMTSRASTESRGFEVELPTTQLERIVASTSFELFVAALILVNTAVMASEIQYRGIEAGYVLGYPDFWRPATEAWPGAEAVFEVLERTFTIIFTVELFLRLGILRGKMLKQPLSWLDILAVVVGWMDWFLSSSMMNPMVIRLLRLAKLARGLRLARIGRVLGSLHLILKSIQASVSTLSWSLCILILVQCITGMILSQMVHGFIIDTTQDLEARQLVFAYYGSFTRSMITMFEVHLASFAPACRILVDHLGETYAFLFLAYRCLAGFAILNVINAVFIQQTMKVAQQDNDIMILMIEQQAKANARYAKELKQWFQTMDENHDNELSWEELNKASDEPNLKLWMRQLDIEPSNLRNLFEIVDINGDGAIDFDELLDGASKIKGTAKKVDLVYMLMQMKKLDEKVDALLSRDNANNANEKVDEKVDEKVGL